MLICTIGIVAQEIVERMTTDACKPTIPLTRVCVCVADSVWLPTSKHRKTRERACVNEGTGLRLPHNY